MLLRGYICATGTRRSAHKKSFFRPPRFEVDDPSRPRPSAPRLVGVLVNMGLPVRGMTRARRATTDVVAADVSTGAAAAANTVPSVVAEAVTTAAPSPPAMRPQAMHDRSRQRVFLAVVCGRAGMRPEHRRHGEVQKGERGGQGRGPTPSS